jgi:crotonobetainyl-CoA:carnitine CoA-transferase CaiB-like acyl-CoA transferase
MSAPGTPAAAPAPLAGLKVVESTHMVMGPAVGAILVELGAEVVRIEPPGGDATRRLPGSGAGYFAMYNRNKKSVCLDLKHPRGIELARQLAARADVLVENFRSGTMDKLGLGYEALAALNPRLIYCAEKGFLSGPYEHRTALDEVAQMMGGLAYMTGPPGRPLRAGSSVIDVTGGMFGVIGVLAALEERHRTGRGRRVSSALFETTVYLVGQHMAQKAVTGQAARRHGRSTTCSRPRTASRCSSAWSRTRSGRSSARPSPCTSSAPTRACAATRNGSRRARRSCRRCARCSPRTPRPSWSPHSNSPACRSRP